jgi:hypothetical protein
VTELDDKLRQVLHDDRWALPTWPDPMARIQASRRGRSGRRHQTLAVGAVAAVVAIVVLVQLPLVRGHNPGPGRRHVAAPIAPCRSGWQVSPEPFGAGDRAQRLLAIAAASSSDAWAVGESFGTGGASDPTIEHWDGQTWEIVPGGDPHANGSLNAVAVIGPKDVWAVGGTESPRNAPLVEHWDGTSWKLVDVPALTDAGPHQLQTLVGVAGTSSNDVWVLGGASVHGTNFESPLLHWNGASWTRVAGPSASAAVSLFTGIALNPVTGSPWIVGGQLRGAGETSSFDGALARSWNGSTWAVRRVPRGPLPLTALGFAGRQQVWAIRQPALQASPDLFQVGGAGASTVVRWNGQRWTTALSSKGSLDSLAVLANTDVWVAGNLRGPLLMHWDGTSWTTPSGSAPVSLPSGLSALTVANDRTVLALGASTTKAGGQLALWTQCAAASTAR